MPFSAMVSLINFMDREVFSVDVGPKLRLERCLHLAHCFPIDIGKVRMLLDLTGTMSSTRSTKAIGRVAK